MTRENAIKYAKEDITKYNCNGYVIIHYDKPSALRMYFMGSTYTTQEDYDYILFADSDELLNFCHGKYGSDYLDRSSILCDGERITDVYSRTKLIIM